MKGKPSALGPATPSNTDLKWSPIIDQFQLRLKQSRPFIHVLWTLSFGQIAERPPPLPPPRQGEMKGDGGAERFWDRHRREPTLQMVMDCLYAWLPPCFFIVHSVGSQGAAPHSKVTGAWLEPGPHLQHLDPPGGAGQVQSH